MKQCYIYKFLPFFPSVHWVIKGLVNLDQPFVLSWWVVAKKRVTTPYSVGHCVPSTFLDEWLLSLPLAQHCQFFMPSSHLKYAARWLLSSWSGMCLRYGCKGVPSINALFTAPLCVLQRCLGQIYAICWFRTPLHNVKGSCTSNYNAFQCCVQFGLWLNNQGLKWVLRLHRWKTTDIE